MKYHLLGCLLLTFGFAQNINANDLKNNTTDTTVEEQIVQPEDEDYYLTYIDNNNLNELLKYTSENFDLLRKFDNIDIFLIALYDLLEKKLGNDFDSDTYKTYINRDNYDLAKIKQLRQDLKEYSDDRYLFNINILDIKSKAQTDNLRKNIQFNDDNFMPIKNNGNILITTYTIQKDDNLEIISKKLNIPEDAILKANPELNLLSSDGTRTIVPGQEIIVPNYKTLDGNSNSDNVYTVKGDETLWKISHKHGTTVKALLKANPQLVSEGDVTYITDGQQIIIP